MELKYAFFFVLWQVVGRLQDNTKHRYFVHRILQQCFAFSHLGFRLCRTLACFTYFIIIFVQRANRHLCIYIVLFLVCVCVFVFRHTLHCKQLQRAGHQIFHPHRTKAGKKNVQVRSGSQRTPINNSSFFLFFKLRIAGAQHQQVVIFVTNKKR